MPIAHRWSIAEIGRIVIYKGSDEIFCVLNLHYNDTCKDKEDRAWEVSYMVKVVLHILNMKNFLETIQACSGKVFLLAPGEGKVSIQEPKVQDNLWRQYLHHKNYLRIVLEISDPKDYRSIVSYYAGDC